MKRKTLKIKNGETISYIDQGEGKKVLVLIHGNTSSSVFYKPMLELMPRNIRIIAPDLRGFGNSSYESRYDSLKELAEDINELLIQLGIKHFDVAGWSLGGGVAMELVLMNNNAEKLILISSTTHKGYPLYQKDANMQPIIGKAYESKEAMSKDPLQVLPLLQIIETNNIEMMKMIFNATIYTESKPSEEDQNLYASEALKERSLVDADWAISSLNLSAEPNAYAKGNNAYKDITIPVLHILGDNDLLVPESMLEDNVSTLLGNSKVLRYDKCSHSPFVDKPTEITKDVLDFIKET